MVDHAPGINDIEGRILEGQVLGIPLFKLRCETEEFQAPLRVRHGPLGQVDSGKDRARRRESLVVGTESDAYLKHALAACAFERCKILDVGLELVPAACLLEIALPLGRV
jgi:hypothetical protein